VPWDPVLGPATYFDNLSKGTLDQVAAYYKQARTAWSTADQWGSRAAQYFDRAMQPSDSLLWRLPILRDVREGWLKGGGNYAQDVANSYKAQANDLETAARDLDESRPWAKGLSKVVNTKTISALDAATAGWGQWAEDSAHHVGLQQKITDTVATGAYHAAASYAGGVAAAAACGYTGVGLVVSSLCAGVGSYLGGKFADVTHKYVDAAANWTVNTAKDVGSAIGGAASDAGDWAKDHLCPFC
jgi:hypothetical protein